MTDDTRVHVRPRGRRDDGAATRQQILEVAGAVFAEKGFDRATGKEITERARANSAAVNYYYGGIDQLYGEVLVEAHRRLVAYDVLAAIAKGEGRPEDKLRLLLRVVVKAILGPNGSSWALRVLSREILAPSAMFHVLRERELLPKKQLLAGLVAEMLGLPVEHPSVSRSCISIAAPFVVLLIGDRQVVTQMFPGLDRDERAVDDMVEHLIRFSLGGIAGIVAAQPKP